MGQRPPYIPRADGALRDWLNTFARIVARDPYSFGATPAEAELLTTLAAAYETAYVQATSIETRTPGMVAAKNAARKRAWTAFRASAMRIKCNLGVVNAQKITLGIIPLNNSQSPIPAPTTAPALIVGSGSPGRHRVRYVNPANPSRTRKPYGVSAVQLAIAVTDRTGRAVQRAGDIKIATRHVFHVDHDPADAGCTAMYTGRWMTERGLTGPWSSPVWMTVV